MSDTLPYTMYSLLHVDLDNFAADHYFGAHVEWKLERLFAALEENVSIGSIVVLCTYIAAYQFTMCTLHTSLAECSWY